VDSKAWHRKKRSCFGVLRQSAAPTPLWLCLKLQISLELRQPNPFPPNQELNPLHCEQRGIHNRYGAASSNEWQRREWFPAAAPRPAALSTNFRGFA
jgi:hypothetical protein